jgi:hypothetical protein
MGEGGGGEMRGAVGGGLRRAGDDRRLDSWAPVSPELCTFSYR